MVKNCDKTGFSVKEEGSLYFQDRLCMLDDKELKKIFYLKHIIRYLPCILEVIRLPGFETAVLVERNEKRCDRVCSKCLTCQASQS